VVNVCPKEKANHLVNDLQMICKYEGRQSLSGIAGEAGFVVSTVNMMVKDAACIEEHVKGAVSVNRETGRCYKCDGGCSCVCDVRYKGDRCNIQEHLKNWGMDH
jgi:hypothetical protein